MTHQTFSKRDKSGEGELFCQLWEPQESPIALLCLIHGQSEHSNRYQHVAEFFCNRQIAFIALDLIGHGNSYGQKGHAKDMQAYIDNVDVLVAEGAARFQNIPRFIYGHSMGGNIVANYALNGSFDATLHGIILTSPWLKLAFEPPKFKVLLASVMRYIYPAFNEFNKLDGSGLSRDEEVGQAYEADPLVHGNISVGAFFACHEGGLYALENAHRLPKPTLLFHGTADPVTSHDASKEFAQKAGGLVQHTEWEGAYHELHNETIKEEVLEAIFKWVIEQVNES